MFARTSVSSLLSLALVGLTGACATEVPVVDFGTDVVVLPDEGPPPDAGPPPCPANTSSCVQPKLLQQCDAAGQETLTVCDFGCLNGQCSEIVCSAGRTFCEPDGNKVQRCSVDGRTIEPVESCPHGCDPATATCREAACAPNETRCAPQNEDEVEVCNSAQTGFESTGHTCSEGCQNGACFVSACPANARRCSATGIEQCNAQGTGFSQVETCQYGCLSNNEGEALCATCPPGAYGCFENSVVYCEAPFLPWSQVDDCGDIETCSGGQCVDVLTLEGNSSSKNTLVPLLEAVADCWLVMESADDKNGTCRGLRTVALEGDIERGWLIDWFCNAADDFVTEDDFSDPEHFQAAKDVLGCGLLKFVDLTIDTPGERIHAGLSQVECIGHEKNEVIVAPCESFGE